MSILLCPLLTQFAFVLGLSHVWRKQRCDRRVFLREATCGGWLKRLELAVVSLVTPAAFALVVLLTTPARRDVDAQGLILCGVTD